jgi:hypothetical protein
MADRYQISNPGSALGEAIGAIMEEALKELLAQTADQYGYHYLTSGVRETKSGTRYKKLLMFDNFGNEYDIDGVIANEAMQPLILFESKYIRYTKHNRDKGSWLCTAHSAVRRRYHSIRSSIAVLAGSWSSSSVAMMESYDINIFQIPFNHIINLLGDFGIDFDWAEKDRGKAFVAWEQFNNLNALEKAQIGRLIVAVVEDKLSELIEKILDDTIQREVEKVVLELVSNLGEVKVYEFDSVDAAISFLNDEDIDSLFITGDSLTLFDPKPVYE